MNFETTVKGLLVVFVVCSATLKVECIEQLSIYFSVELPRRVEFSNDTGTVLHCLADGTPKPEVQWTLVDRSTLKDVLNLRVDYHNGTLYFPPFSAEDYRDDVHATTYICAASSYRGVLVSNEVYVRAVVKQHYEVQVYDEFVIKGNTGVLRCHIPSFVEEYLEVVAWVTDAGITISKHESVDRFIVTTHGELYVSNVLSSDETKRFQCKTINRLTGESRVSQAGRIMIIDTQSSMPPRIAHTRPTVSIQQGERVELICASQGLPIPTYRWFKVNEHEAISLGNEGRVRQWKSLLLLTHAQTSDSGVYKCVAVNSIGEDSAETILKVNVPLTIQVSPRIQTVDVDKAAAMTCIANGYPPTTSFVWYKNGRAIAIDDRVSFTAGKMLTIASTQRDDQGIYQCFIRNDEISAYGVAELKLGRVLPVITQHFIQQAIIPGTDISLKCVASGNPTPTIRWSLDELPTSATSSESYSSTSGGDIISYLNVSHVRMEDGGEYRCIADNGVGMATHAARVNVIGPPYVRPMRNLTVIAGQTVAIQCRVTGYPIHSITWTKGDAQLPLDPRQHVQKNGSLSISSVDKSFDEGIYTCTARNDRGDSASGQVSVDVTVPPQIAPFSFPPKLHVGTRARLQCVITEGDLPITFLWLKDGYPLTDDLELLVKQDDEFSSSLTFTTIHTRHNGNYTCVARNAAATINYSSALVVDVPPFWLVQPTDVSVSFSQSALLTCTADGYPKPVIIWKKEIVSGGSQNDFEPLSFASGKNQMMANGSLLINAADEYDEGHYLCQARNGIGPGLNKVVHVSVEAAVHFDVKHHNVTAKKGDTTALMCLAKGDFPIKTVWSLNGLTIDANVDYRYVIKEHPGINEITSILEIFNVDVRDSGSYTCQAFNSFGKDDMVIYLSVRDIPDAPESVKITEHLSRYVRLTWMPPFDGGSPILQYIVQYKNGSEDWASNHHNVSVEHPETTAVIKSLRPGNAYSFRVIATNEVGAGKPSSGIGIRTSEEAPTGAPRDVEGHSVSSTSLKIRWKSPLKEECNGEIIGYSIGYKLFPSNEAYTFKMVDANVSKHEGFLLGNLSKYTKYSVTVKAFNRIGAGPRSKELVLTTAEDVPSDAPTNIRCTSSTPESLSLVWDPPEKNAQNGVIQQYKIRYQPMSHYRSNVSGHAGEQPQQSKMITEKTVPSNTLSLTATSLQKFTNYSFQLTASTRMGEGVLSEAVFCRTQEDVPGPPADIKAITMSSNVILVTWKIPQSPNGQIVNYNVYVRRSDGNTDTAATKHLVLPSNNLQYEAKALKEGSRYDFWVTASTTVGEGSSTRVVSQTAQYRAAAGIAAFSTKVFSYWQHNASLQCPVIGIPFPKRNWMHKNMEKTNDRVTISKDGNLDIVRVQRQDAGNYTCTAKNSYGSDQIVYELVVLAPPHAPYLSATKVTTTSIVMSLRSAGDGGAPIKGYVVSYKESNGKWSELRLDNSADKLTLSNLRCGTPHHIYVTAHNEVGIGEPSTILSISTRGSVPSKPRLQDIVHVNATSISLALFRWPTNECPVKHYSLLYRQKASEKWTPVMDNVPLTQKQIVITHLQPGTAYEVQLNAHNDAGITEAIYGVTTLVYIKGSNGTLIMAPAAVTTPFYEDMSIVVPAVSSTIATIAMLIGICACIQRNHRRQGVSEKSRHKDPQLSRALDVHQECKCYPDQQLQGNPMAYHFHQHASDKVKRDKHVNLNDKSNCDVEEEYEEEYDIISSTSIVLNTSRTATALMSPSRRHRRIENSLALSRPASDHPPSGHQTLLDEQLCQLALDFQQTLPNRHCRYQYDKEDTLPRNACSNIMNEQNQQTSLTERDLNRAMQSSINNAHTHLDSDKSQSWDTLAKCLHRYPDLLYHGPESETSDEADFDDVHFSMSVDRKSHSGIDCQNENYPENSPGNIYRLLESLPNENLCHHGHQECSNYPFLHCHQASSLSS